MAAECTCAIQDARWKEPGTHHLSDCPLRTGASLPSGTRNYLCVACPFATTDEAAALAHHALDAHCVYREASASPPSPTTPAPRPDVVCVDQLPGYAETEQTYKMGYAEGLAARSRPAAPSETPRCSRCEHPHPAGVKCGETIQLGEDNHATYVECQCTKGSGTYGELPAAIRALIVGHEWDNMTAREQRAWLIDHFELRLASPPAGAREETAAESKTPAAVWAQQMVAAHGGIHYEWLAEYHARLQASGGAPETAPLTMDEINEYASAYSDHVNPEASSIYERQARRARYNDAYAKLADRLESLAARPTEVPGGET